MVAVAAAASLTNLAEQCEDKVQHYLEKVQA